jgi:hypothetical protein
MYSGPVAATSLAASGHPGTSIHIHVNVANVNARGSLLTVEEILAVWLAWVQFDQVTVRFARPWMWREPSMAPMFATGPEFSWSERAWEQGTKLPSSTNEATKRSYDIPSFVAAVHEIRKLPEFSSYSEAEKRELFFGPGSPGRQLGRYCSLNLCKVTSYGTLEFRRFHATLDAVPAVNWAHFCVSFVEASMLNTSLVAAVFDQPVAQGLQALREVQEHASLSELGSSLQSVHPEYGCGELLSSLVAEGTRL